MSWKPRVVQLNKNFLTSISGLVFLPFIAAMQRCRCSFVSLSMSVTSFAQNDAAVVKSGS